MNDREIDALARENSEYLELAEKIVGMDTDMLTLGYLLGDNDDGDMLGAPTFDIRLKNYRSKYTIPGLIIKNDEDGEGGLSNEDEIKCYIAKHYNDIIAEQEVLKQRLKDLCDELMESHTEALGINQALLELNSDIEMNELHRTITQMVYIFWTAALHTGAYEECTRINFPTEKYDVESNLLLKIKTNMLKIRESEQKLFSLDSLTIDGIQYDQYVDIFTPEIIEDIASKFKTDTIKYTVGGEYNCNETHYREHVCNTHFGFFNLKGEKN